MFAKGVGGMASVEAIVAATLERLAAAAVPPTTA